MVRRISHGSCEISSSTDIFQRSPRRESRLVLAAIIAVFRREQTTACAVVSLHVGVGVILTAKAPNRRRSRRPFGGRDDAGPRSRNTGERKWTRPHCSSSSSWCCCSAAADSSIDAGVESTGASLAGIVRPLTHVHRSHGRSPILAGSATVHVASLRSTNRCTAHSLGTQSFVTRNRATLGLLCQIRGFVPGT